MTRIGRESESKLYYPSVPTRHLGWRRYRSLPDYCRVFKFPAIFTPSDSPDWARKCCSFRFTTGFPTHNSELVTRICSESESQPDSACTRLLGRRGARPARPEQPVDALPRDERLLQLPEKQLQRARQHVHVVHGLQHAQVALVHLGGEEDDMLWREIQT